MQPGKYGNWNVKGKALLAFQVRYGSYEREAVRIEKTDGAGLLGLKD